MRALVTTGLQKNRTGKLNFAKLCHAAHFHPFHNVDIALMVDDAAMGANEFAGGEIVARFCAQLTPAIATITKMGDQLVLFVEQGDFRCQIRYQHFALVQGEVAGHVRIVDEMRVLPIQGKVLQAIVATVGNGQHFLLATAVNNDAVGGIELAGFFAFSTTEAANELAFLCVLVDKAGPVAITNVDVAVF